MTRHTEPFYLRPTQHRYKESKRSWYRKQPILSPPLTHYRAAITDAQRKTYRSPRKFPWAAIPLAGLLLLFLGAGTAFYTQSLQMSHASGVSGRKVLVSPTPTSSSVAVAPLNMPPINDNAVTANQWTAMNATQIAYIDKAMHIEYISSTDNSRWQLIDLTQWTHAPLADGHAITSYQWSPSNTQQIVYIDTQNHIQLLYRGTNGLWQRIDLTRLTAAPPSNGMALSAFEWLQFGTEQIVYIDEQQHVHELESFDGQHWNDTDLTKVTGAPLASGNQVRGFAWTAGNSKQIVYIDVNKHIQELRLISGGHWQLQDLTQVTSAPLANDRILVGYEWHSTSTQIIDYIDQDNAIQELTSSPTGEWTITDLTQLTGGPISNGEALTGFEWLSGNERDIAYISNQGDLIQLALQPGVQWQVSIPERAPGPDGSTLLGLDGSLTGSKQLIYKDTAQHIQVLKITYQKKWQLVQW